MPNNRFLAVVIVGVSLMGVTTASARDNSTDLYRKAEQIALEGNLDDAIRAFARVIRVNPYYALGHYGLGKAYLYKEGMVEEGVRHLEIAVRCDRDLAKGYFYLGIGYILIRKYTYAVHALRNAYDKDKRIIEALYNLSIVYDKIGKKYHSTMYFERYLLEKRKRELDIIF